MDIDAVRAAGDRVMERRRFAARTAVEVPRRGVRSASTCTVDLDRGLARVSTAATMGPVAGTSTSWTPQTGDPVVHWVVDDHLLMQLPDKGGASRWVSVPDTALLGSELSLLLWPAGVVQAHGPDSASGAVSAVVDLAHVLQQAPEAHRAGVAQFIEELGLEADARVAVELTLVDGALSQIDAEVLVDVDGEPLQRLIHLSVDQDVPAPLGDPPHAQEEVSASEITRRLEANVPGGPRWWTRTRPLRV